MDDDGALVQKYLSGDEDAFATLVNKHVDRVFSFSLRLASDSSFAEDITQQTFINAWKHLGTYNTNRRFVTWLLSIAHNVAIDYLRKKRSVPFSQFDTESGGNVIVETTSDTEPLPDELYARQELGNELAGALVQLSTIEREVLTLHYEQELTFEEMAEMLGKSRNTLKSQHRRAIEKLRQVLIAPKS